MALPIILAVVMVAVEVIRMDKEQPLVEAVAVVLASVRATLTATQVENEKLREALEKLLAEARERGGALSDGEVLGCAAIRNSKALSHSSETSND